MKRESDNISLTEINMVASYIESLNMKEPLSQFLSDIIYAWFLSDISYMHGYTALFHTSN